MRALIVDDEAKAKVARVLAHAEAHHYRPGDDKVPGDDPKFVAQLNTYRAVFTFTHLDGIIYRHLSVSIPGRKLPHQAAVFVIASLFGFTGWDEQAFNLNRLPEGWMATVSEIENCIIVAQKYGKEVH